MPIKKQMANTQDLVAVNEIRDNTVILKNGSLRQVVMVGGINTALKSEPELDLISAAYRNFLNSLGFQIQIIIHSRKVNIEKYLAGLEARKQEEPSPLLQSQIDEYKEFISGFVRENDIMEKIFLVVVPFIGSALPSKETVAGLTKFIPFLKKKEEEKKEEEFQKKLTQEAGFEESLNQLKQRVNQVVEGLKTIGLESAVLGNQELIELFYNFYNPETVEKEKIMPNTKLQMGANPLIDSDK